MLGIAPPPAIMSPSAKIPPSRARAHDDVDLAIDPAVVHAQLDRHAQVLVEVDLVAARAA
jgi:hypothetical protein